MVWSPCKIWARMGIFWFLLSVSMWPFSLIFLSLLAVLQSERKLNPGLTGRVFFISLDRAPFDLYLLANDFLNPKWFGNNCSSFSDYCPSPIVNLWNPLGLEYILVCVCHKLAWTGIAAHVQLHLQSCCVSCRKTCLDGVKYSPGERAAARGLRATPLCPFLHSERIHFQCFEDPGVNTKDIHTNEKEKTQEKKQNLAKLHSANDCYVFPQAALRNVITPIILFSSPTCTCFIYSLLEINPSSFHSCLVQWQGKVS